MTTYWVGEPALAGAAGGRRIDLGPDHPTRAGVVRITVEGAPIARAEVTSGWLHRGAEKLFEVRDLRAALALANRHDWHSPVSGELTVALAVEAGLGIGVPERATWLRTLAAEHARLHAHLGFLGWLGIDGLAAAREALREQLAAWTGNRLHPMITRIGGVAADLPSGWLDAERALAQRIAGLGARAERAVGERPGLDVGEIPPAEIGGLGLSGPAARAAGLPWDVRRERPYLAYPELDRDLDPRVAGSTARARLLVLARELTISAGLVLDCAGALERVGGPIDTQLPQIIRLPEGVHYRDVEAPLGEAGARIVSRGEKVAWRLSLRTPSQANAHALERALVRCGEADVEAVVASLPWVIGDLDK